MPPEAIKSPCKLCLDGHIPEQLRAGGVTRLCLYNTVPRGTIQWKLYNTQLAMLYGSNCIAHRCTKPLRGRYFPALSLLLQGHL